MPGTIVARAPGRVNLIGEHTDYNGGLCLPFAIDLATTVTLKPRDDHHLMFSSREAQDSWEGRIADLAPGSVSGWAAYPAGVLWALREDGWPVPGCELQIESDVPLGAGLSSSASLECAVARAVAGLLERPLNTKAHRRHLAELCRRAETEFVGAPTGGMDQLAAMVCREGHALLIDFADGSTRHVRFPAEEAGLALLVVDTGVAHDLAAAESGYATRRAECEAGHPARVRHVETENQRVEDAAVFLHAQDWEQLGRLLTASHRSLRDDFEVSTPELDAAVATALEAGALGARMTGGGFGGATLALLPQARIDAARRAITNVFTAEGWAPPSFYVVSPAGPAQLL